MSPRARRVAFVLVATLANILVVAVLLLVILGLYGLTLGRFLSLAWSGWVILIALVAATWVATRIYRKAVDAMRSSWKLDEFLSDTEPKGRDTPTTTRRSLNMPKYKESLEGLGVGLPEILLPAESADYGKWAVVACDQYSSEREYWEKVDGIVGSAPSTLRLIYPECYLEEAEGLKKARIDAIQASMRDYLARGLLVSQGPGFVLVERSTPFEKETRKGLMIAVDLEKYQYGKDSRSLIRPTEGTIVERIPPRLRIRKGAPLEVPHIMLLIDDPARSIIEPLYRKRSTLPVAYDFELMTGSGHVKGWRVSDQASFEGVAKALEKIADKKAFKAKYGKDDLLLFAVGDGNHSLATAKGGWEEIKAAAKGDPAIMSHPARWALVELVNIYDEGLPFHPIHRVLFNVDQEAFFAELSKYRPCEVEARKHAEEAFAFADADAEAKAACEHRVAFMSAKGQGVIRFRKPEANLAAGTIQSFLDAYIKSHPDVGIDYIHGTDSLIALAEKPGNLGLYLPPIDKHSFFGTVIRDGVMPRKTFSMGEAPEKRFYVEARRITR